MSRASSLLLALSILLLGAVPPLHAKTSACEGRELQTCFETPGCFVDCAGKDKQRCSPYLCRAARDDCERISSQKGLTREKCEAVPGCRYSAAFCFCPGPMECFCGGGAPAMCVRRE